MTYSYTRTLTNQITFTIFSIQELSTNLSILRIALRTLVGPQGAISASFMFWLIILCTQMRRLRSIYKLLLDYCHK